VITSTLGDLVSALIESLGAVPRTGAGIRVDELFVDLPVEVRLARVDGDLALAADAPQWRWRTDFDRDPGRIVLRLEDRPA
jgi:hypothetical protein